MVQWLTSLTALVAAVVALIFQIDPGRSPDPKVQESAKVTVTTVDRNVVDPAARQAGTRVCSTLAGSSGRSPSTAASALGKAPVGAVVYARLHVHGLKHGVVRVRCGVFNAAQNVAIASPAMGEPVALSEEVTTNDEAVAPLFVELPTYPGELKVRVAAFDERGTMLDYGDSKPFPSGVLASPEVRRATASEERRISHAVIKATPLAERPHYYLSAVGVLKRGGPFNRGRWAVVNVTPFPRYRTRAPARVALLHVTMKGWHVVPDRDACMVPDEIVIALNLSSPHC
jgi:hypothetical protein